MRLEKSIIDQTKTKLKNYLNQYPGERIDVENQMNQGIDPLTTPGYLQKAFPHLFPRGEISLDNRMRIEPISEVELIKHLVNLHDQRFCQDPVLPYVLMDIKNRVQTKRLTRFFISRNPIEGAMSTEQLLQLPENDLLKKIYPCLSPVLGSVGYYKDKRKKLK